MTAPPLTRRGFLAAATAATVLAACGDDAATTPTDEGESTDVDAKRIAYGDHAEQFGDLWLPASVDDALPVVVLIHGGFWRQEYGLDLMDGLAASVAANGYAAWNIEYRRVGGDGGYPETFADVADAVDHLASIDERGLDTSRVAVVGHSAGGHLAAWVASRGVLPADAPWSDPVIRPVVVFPQAGVLDLVSCAEEGVGGTACPDLLGGPPAQEPDRYALASPVQLLPAGIPVIAVHGARDGNVPLSQSESYVDRAIAAGDPAELVVIDGADHFDVIDPGHESWAAILDRLPQHLRV